jgi:hypothetical protein
MKTRRRFTKHYEREQVAALRLLDNNISVVRYERGDTIRANIGAVGVAGNDREGVINIIDSLKTYYNGLSDKMLKPYQMSLRYKYVSEWLSILTAAQALRDSSKYQLTSVEVTWHKKAPARARA